ncbi:hypothetical protein [uncultured Lacinutrix sp.]|uniref:hypothetical protein n=1 Tax=uncultured Lacinutrix sp. TaxID=574032 RepID=UPI00261E73CC|nr:hypothetical protein [uncultured Lacinutrix sp.]
MFVKILDCDQGSAITQINQSTFEDLLNIYFEDNCTQDQGQHDFMITSMLPVMMQILSEVKDSLIPENQQESIEGFDFLSLTENQTDPLLTESTIFNWSSMYYYLSLTGLHTVNSFDEIIPDGTASHFLWQAYRAKLNTLSKNCYE